MKVLERLHGTGIVTAPDGNQMAGEIRSPELPKMNLKLDRVYGKLPDSSTWQVWCGRHMIRTSC